jgi:hypothetical protein
VAGEVSPLVKLAYTVLVVIIVPVYWRHYGWRNFLWFSDIALFTVGAALWLESALLVSMMAVGVLLPELLWMASFFGRLLFGVRASGLADYMFDVRNPLPVRALSLFHVVLPVVIVWLLARWGYDSRALVAQTLLAWIVLPVTYAVLRPGDENVNWVRGYGSHRLPIPPLAHLALLMAGFPLLIHMPAHFVLDALFGSR